MRGQGGLTVARPDGGTALEDLEWLGLDPNELLPSNRKDRCQALAAELVERGVAYPCFCTPAELREMYSLQASNDRPLRYDGRCRRLSATDIEALRRAGRSPCVRLALPDSPVHVTDVTGASYAVETVGLDDFRIVLTDGNPSEVFGDLVDDMDAEVTQVLWLKSRRGELVTRAVLSQVLGWTLPRLVLLEDWIGADGKPIGHEGSKTSIGELRAAGFHPRALLIASARAGWSPGDSLELDDLVQRFELEALADQPVTYDPVGLREVNREVLSRISLEDAVHAVVDHLDRRGYPMSERDPEWQRQFVTVIRADLTTLADAEDMAALLLTPTVDYDREVARTLREPATQQLITQFEGAMQGVPDFDVEAWREALARFRSTLSAPGRGLATLRLVLTGQRNGPSLPAILSLLGQGGCRVRIEKARRYSGT